MSKIAAIRDAVKELGLDASSETIAKHLADKQITMSPAYIANCLSTMRRKTKLQRPRPPGRPRKSTVVIGHMALPDILSLRKLCKTYGPKTISSVVHVLDNGFMK